MRAMPAEPSLQPQHRRVGTVNSARSSASRWTLLPEIVPSYGEIGTSGPRRLPQVCRSRSRDCGETSRPPSSVRPALRTGVQQVHLRHRFLRSLRQHGAELVQINHGYSMMAWMHPDGRRVAPGRGADISLPARRSEVAAATAYCRSSTNLRRQIGRSGLNVPSKAAGCGDSFQRPGWPKFGAGPAQDDLGILGACAPGYRRPGDPSGYRGAR